MQIALSILIYHEQIYQTQEDFLLNQDTLDALPMLHILVSSSYTRYKEMFYSNMMHQNTLNISILKIDIIHRIRCLRWSYL